MDKTTYEQTEIIRYSNERAKQKSTVKEMREAGEEINGDKGAHLIEAIEHLVSGNHGHGALLVAQSWGPHTNRAASLTTHAAACEYMLNLRHARVLWHELGITVQKLIQKACEEQLEVLDSAKREDNE